MAGLCAAALRRRVRMTSLYCITQRSSWCRYPSSRFAALLHYAPDTVDLAQARADLALAQARNIQWMYILDSNNYANIPSFYRQLYA